MKKTKKQYYPQVMYKKYRAGEWSDIMYMDVNGNKKYADYLIEAEQAIENTKKINLRPVKDDAFEIVDTRIRVREVTEWELVK